MGKNDEENAAPTVAAVEEPAQPEATHRPTQTQKAMEGEVLPRSAADELEEIQATTAIIAAVGQQLQVIIQTPGVEGFLKGLGDERRANAELVTLNAKNQHEQQMERERRETESLARKETFAVRWIYLLTALIPVWFFALTIMVSKELITSGNAATLTMFVTLAVTALRSIFGKKQSN